MSLGFRYVKSEMQRKCPGGDLNWVLYLGEEGRTGDKGVFVEAGAALGMGSLTEQRVRKGRDVRVRG